MSIPIVDDLPATVITVAIGAIQANPRQPRSSFADQSIRELATSIAEVGILQPIIVRERDGGRFELIAGERRLRAARIAGLETVPAIVRDASDRSSLEMALIENSQREDITPLECARAYRLLMTQFGLTQEQVAAKIGKARTTVANTLRLLRLPPKIQKGLQSSSISEGHARAILAFDHEDHQLAVYEQVLSNGLSVREVEDLAKRKPKAGRSAKAAPSSGPKWASLEDTLAHHLRAPVRIQSSGTGGKITIEFFSEDELIGIVDRIGPLN